MKVLNEDAHKRKSAILRSFLIKCFHCGSPWVTWNYTEAALTVKRSTLFLVIVKFLRSSFDVHKVTAWFIFSKKEALIFSLCRNLWLPIPAKRIGRASASQSLSSSWFWLALLCPWSWWPQKTKVPGSWVPGLGLTTSSVPTLFREHSMPHGYQVCLGCYVHTPVIWWKMLEIEKRPIPNNA